MAKTLINEISIKKKFITAASAPNRVAFFRNSANARVVAAKESLLSDFDNNEATIELQGSPSDRDSKFVNKGNLISFLGLPDGPGVVAEVREYLRENISMGKDAKISVKGNKINFEFKVKVPSKTQVFEAFPSPDGYSSKSFLEIIEKGIGSAAQFIFWSLGFNTAVSRSGTGLQSKGSVKNPGVLKTKPYISEILEKFINRFK